MVPISSRKMHFEKVLTQDNTMQRIANVLVQYPTKDHKRLLLNSLAIPLRRKTSKSDSKLLISNAGV